MESLRHDVISKHINLKARTRTPASEITMQNYNQVDKMRKKAPVVEKRHRTIIHQIITFQSSI